MQDYQKVVKNLFKRRSILSPQARFESFSKGYDTLGRPDLKYPSIHIAGTNGKGSVAEKIARSLELGGFKVGLFTSPHIESFRERISINGEWISEEAVLSGLKACDDAGHFFEITTLLALNYFADENVDIAIIETGLGGEFDATTVIEPILTVITTLSLEHTQVLGNTLGDIARAKSGIIKPHAPLILGPTADHPIIVEKAQQLSAEVIQCKVHSNEYDEENKEIARRTLQYFSLSEDALKQGLQMRPPCRFETQGNIVLDVAHNPAAFEALFKTIERQFPGKEIHLLLAFSEGKELAECAKVIKKKVAHLHLLEMSHPQLMTNKELERVFQTLEFFKITHHSSLSEVIDCAEDQKAVLLIAGSFYMMSEIRSKSPNVSSISSIVG